jgi:regulator of protease activity HflC (stomatin/prohibitin superfamily)|tara:strand:+ start:355 stop:1200 length:846 start_codon:yes stop_codon:yes gene_type:complete
MKKFATRVGRWIKARVPYLVALVLILVLLVLFFWNRIFVVIGPGQAGALYRPLTSGTITDYVYPEGLHVLFPLNRMTIYDTRVQVIQHDLTVLTNRGLPITLKLAVRFRPIYELVGVLHQQVGVDYPKKVILPQIESVLRRRIGQHSPEEIYTNKEGVLSNIISLAIQEVGQKFVEVDEIIIRTVELPEQVKTAIEEKLVYEQQHLAYQFRLDREEQEAERKRIEALGIMVYQDIISSTLDEKLLRWQGIQATLDIAKSDNSKVVVIGAGEQGLPIILGNQ